MLDNLLAMLSIVGIFLVAGVLALAIQNVRDHISKKEKR